MKICPSIASSNLLDLRKEISFIDQKYKHIHIDIEDGNYIPNITFGTKLMERICEESKSEKSIHLMVTSPELYIDSIVRCRPGIVFLHLDNQRYPSKIIRKFQDLGIKVGIAINPNVKIIDINYVLPLVKDVLIMMCEPDGREQQYIEEMEGKIEEIVEKGKIEVWVDGSVTFERLPHLKDLKVSAAVMGRGIFSGVREIREEY